jgi:hypothetical protein
MFTHNLIEDLAEKVNECCTPRCRVSLRVGADRDGFERGRWSIGGLLKIENGTEGAAAEDVASGGVVKITEAVENTGNQIHDIL